MDLKLECPCGQRFAFEVEPVNGEMPQNITCPACSEDRTDLANAQIRQQLAAAPVTPVAPANPAPAVRLRVSATAPSTPPAEPSSAVAAAEVPAPEPSPAPRPRRNIPVPAAPAAAGEEKGGWFAAAKSTIWVLLVCLFAFYVIVAKVRRQMRNLGALDDDKPNPALLVDWTLPDDDGSVILLRGTNDTAVAQLASNYWRDQRKQNLTVTRVPLDNPAVNQSRFVILPPQSGVIQIDGTVIDETSAAAQAGLAQHLSQNLRTMAVSAAMGDDADTGQVIVFDNGQRVFSCDRSARFTKNDLIFDVKLEGQPWAVAKGYQPREGDWKTFTMFDADGLVQHLGFKPLDYSVNGPVLVLR